MNRYNRTNDYSNGSSTPIYDSDIEEEDEIDTTYNSNENLSLDMYEHFQDTWFISDNVRQQTKKMFYLKDRQKTILSKIDENNESIENLKIRLSIVEDCVKEILNILKYGPLSQVCIEAAEDFNKNI